MKTRWLFQLFYNREDPKNKNQKIEISESIVAESWNQAREYWQTEFIDEGIEILQMSRSVPVIAVAPFTRTQPNPHDQ